MTGWTQTPNFIYDLMPEMKEAEIKVVMLIVRQTIGWQRESVSLSVSDFKRMTGLAQASVVSGIKAALDHGILERTGDKNSYTYKIVEPVSLPESVQNLNLFDEPVQILNQNSSNSESKSVQILNDTNIKITKQKEETKGMVADATPTPPIAPVVVKEKPKRHRKPAAKEPAAPKHPAVVIFHELRGRWPNDIQEKVLAEVVSDLELWRLVLEKWRMRGYNPVNVDGMLDWYKHPEKFTERNGATNGNHTNGHSKSYQQPASADFTAAEWREFLNDPEREPSPF